MLLVYSADNKKSHSYFTRCYIQNILVIFITCQICDSVMEEMWVLPWQWHCFPWQLAWVVSLCEVYLYTDYGATNIGIQGCVLYIMKQKKCGESLINKTASIYELKLRIISNANTPQLLWPRPFKPVQQWRKFWQQNILLNTNAATEIRIWTFEKGVVLHC